MTEVVEGQIARYPIRPRNRMGLMLGALAVVLGATFGFLYGHSSKALLQTTTSLPASEIIVSKDHGLLFKSEDGTPLVKIGQDFSGTYVDLLSSQGKPIVGLYNHNGRGGFVVGSKNGSYAYIQSQEDSATITLIGKYGKEVIEITSATSDGGGNISINEGSKGYRAVEIGSGPNEHKSKGTIKITGDNGPVWEAP